MHVPEARAPRSDQLLGFDYRRLKRQLGAFLGPRPSREDLRHLACRRRAILPEYLVQSTATTLLFGLRNAIETVGHLMAQRTPPSPANDEFVGMTEYVAESFHDLSVGETQSPSSSDSSRGNHHPSRECFMAGTPEGHVKSIHEEEATPMNDLDDEVEGDVGAPPCLRMELLKP